MARLSNAPKAGSVTWVTARLGAATPAERARAPDLDDR